MWEVKKRSILGQFWSILVISRSILGQFWSILSKPVYILSRTQSNGRVKPHILHKPAWDPVIRLCSYTPRFSYGVLKRAVRAGSLVVRGGVRVRVYGSGYGTRAGIRVGNTGGYTGYYPASC